MIGVGPDVVTQGRATNSEICKYESVKNIALLPLSVHCKSVGHFKKSHPIYDTNRKFSIPHVSHNKYIYFYFYHCIDILCFVFDVVVDLEMLLHI